MMPAIPKAACFFLKPGELRQLASCAAHAGQLEAVQLPGENEQHMQELKSSDDLERCATMLNISNLERKLVSNVEQHKDEQIRGIGQI